MGLFDGTSLERPVTCEHCGEPEASCVCVRGRDGKASPYSGQKARVRREKRRGKWCCVVAGVDLSDGALKGLLKELRTSLGTGGGITDGEIVIQGDHREAIVELLRGKGFEAKGAGG